MIEKVFDCLTRARNMSYSCGWSSIHKLSRPVVSIGNLTMGGTGKTPFVDFLLDFCDNSKIQVGVLSRGYRRRGYGIEEVDNYTDVARFGDEPCLLKMKHRNSKIFVGKKKAAAGLELIKQYPQVQIVLADDAFQHRALARDIDIVIIDAAQPLSELAVFPKGRARESLIGLRRADFIVLTRRDQVADSDILKLKAILKKYVNSIVWDRLIECRTQLASLRFLSSGQAITSRNTDRFMAVSAVGSPRSFEGAVSSSLARHQSVKHIQFRDHHAYCQEDIDRIEKQANDCEWIVTTEKDAIKIANLNFDKTKWAVLPMQWQASTQIEELYDHIRNLVIS